MKAHTILYILSIIIFSANCFRIIYRRQLQHLRPRITSMEYGYTPASFALLYQTGGPSCFDETTCIARVKSIGESSMNKWGQIVFNYLIGGDGYVYEGSGFYEKIYFLRSLKDKCVTIAFIGDYTVDMPPKSASKSLEELLEFARDFQYLRRDFILLSSSQVEYDDEGPDSDTSLPSDKIDNHPHWNNSTLRIRSRVIKFVD